MSLLSHRPSRSCVPDVPQRYATSATVGNPTGETSLCFFCMRRPFLLFQSHRRADAWLVLAHTDRRRPSFRTGTTHPTLGTQKVVGDDFFPVVLLLLQTIIQTKMMLNNSWGQRRVLLASTPSSSFVHNGRQEDDGGRRRQRGCKTGCIYHHHRDEIPMFVSTRPRRRCR